MAHHPRLAAARTGIKKTLTGVIVAGAIMIAPSWGGAVAANAAAAPAGAVSADAKQERITWAVEPATIDGPDERRWVEQTLDPGQEATEYLAVRNFSNVDVTFALAAADGYFTDKGHFNMESSSVEPKDAGGWISIPETVDVAANETAVVPFTVAVPQNATPGDHAAGVAATVRMVEADAGAEGVGVEGRMGFRVMTRVTGELAPGLAVEQFTVDNKTNWNPLQPGRADVELTVRNTGNVGLVVDGNAHLGGHDAPLISGGDQQEVELLPGASHVFKTNLADVWPLGPQSWEAQLAATTVGEEPQEVNATGQHRAWALPIPQVLALVGSVLIALAFASDRKRKNERTARLVSEARAQGRAEALQAQETSSPHET